LFPTPQTSATIKTPENTEEGPDDPQPADEVTSKWDTPLISFTDQL